MHVLSKPVERHFAPDALRLRRLVDFRADCGELRAQADVVHEAGDLPVAFPSFDPAAKEL